MPDMSGGETGSSEEMKASIAVDGTIPIARVGKVGVTIAASPVLASTGPRRGMPARVVRIAG